MTNKAAFVLNYWKPEDEEPKVVTSYLNYLRDTSLQHYGEETMNKFVHSAKEDQVKSIKELGKKMGRGSNILFNPLEDLNSTFSFFNRNIDFAKEQQRLDHIMSYDLSTLLRIDESEMEFAKRGRKSNLNPEFIEQMKKLQIGKLYAIREFQIIGETDKEIIKTKKSGIAMKLRSALRQANRQEFQIKWTTDLIPCVKVNK